MKKNPRSKLEITRRDALVGLGVGLGTTTACGFDGEGVGPSAAPSTPMPPVPSTPHDEPTTPVTPAPPPPVTETLTPKELLAGIDHIVVLMMENRSFDHFLGSLKSDAGYAGKAIVEGLVGNETNPAPDGTTVASFKMTNFTPEDPPHGWDPVHLQFNNGKNDGFVISHEGDSQNEVMGFHDRSQLPLYYWFADNFAICDHWYASVLGPTWPNRFYLHATTSSGTKDNRPIIVNPPETIWDRLKTAGKSFKNYAAGVTTFYVGGFVTKLLTMNPSARVDDFFDAAKSGELPSFSLIDPDFQASDDHPAHNIQRGQAFVASIYKALSEGPAWNKTLFIITYDEHGGFFDHVVPPVAVDADADFAHQGFRVPAFVIGPTVKKGYVCKTPLEHSSVAATLRTRFDITSLSKRMDAASDITDCIDALKVKAPAAPPMGMPQVAMTMQAALYDGVGFHSQPALEKLVAEGAVPVVDDRSHQERIGSWLAHASRLGAVRIVP